MQSLNRALTLLTELSRSSPRTLTDLTETVGLHKSTVHRMLATFTDFGLVRRDEANRYVIGLGALDLARAAAGDTGPGPAVKSALADLHAQIGQVASYGQPRAGQITRTAVAGLPSSTPDATTPLPLYATALGKAYLSHRPRPEVDRYVARAPFDHLTPRTVTDAYGLLRSLAWARAAGYAVEDREFVRNGRAVGAPVLDDDGLAIAAVAARVPPHITHPAELRRMAAAVVSCADHIGSALLHSNERPAAIHQSGAVAQLRGA